MESRFPLTKLRVDRRWSGDGAPAIHEVLEGEVTMTQQEQDQYRGIVGDGKARVSVSRDISEKDFGQGGSIGINITLTCDQSENGLNWAAYLASEFAKNTLNLHYEDFRRYLQGRGLIK